MLGSKMESKSNDVAKAAMNEIWGILFSPMNMAGKAYAPPPPTTPNRPTWTPPPT